MKKKTKVKKTAPKTKRKKKENWGKLSPAEVRAVQQEAHKEVAPVARDLEQHKIEEKTQERLEEKIAAHRTPEELAREVLNKLVVEVSGGLELLSDHPLTEKGVGLIMDKLKEHHLTIARVSYHRL